MHPPVVKFGLEVHHAQGVSLEARKRGNAQPVKRATRTARLNQSRYSASVIVCRLTL